MNTENLNKNSLLRMKDLKGITGLSEMTIRRLVKQGEFPQPRRYPAMKRAVFFVYGEVLDWLDNQKAGV